MIALYLAPFVVIVVLLVSRRASLLQAGVGGLLLALPIAYFALPLETSRLAFIATQTVKGAWLAWQAIAVILAGLLFHHVVKATQPQLFNVQAASTGAFSYRRLFAVCFLLGPFFESATGFGVGLIITVPFLLRMGIAAPVAVTFALLSQILVPWGALAVGTSIGAELARLPVQELGVRSALLSGPLLFGYLGLFWRFSRAQGWRVPFMQKLDDLGWIAALCVLLYIANRYVAVESAGLLSTGTLLIARFLRDRDVTQTQWRNTTTAALPYILLTGLLLVRSVPPLAPILSHALVLQPQRDWPKFAVFHHVSFWLVLTALLYGMLQHFKRTDWREAAVGALTMARIPVVVTLIYVVMAQVMSGAGIAAQLAQAWHTVAGDRSILAIPVFAAIAGFLTASNVASNAMLMPIQSAIAGVSAHDPSWVAALQNTAGSNLTMLSPIRVAMGCALLKINGIEHRIYASAFPFGLVAIGILVITAVFI